MAAHHHRAGRARRPRAGGARRGRHDRRPGNRRRGLAGPRCGAAQAARRARPGGPSDLRLHRCLRARGCRASGWSTRNDALALCGAAGELFPCGRGGPGGALCRSRDHRHVSGSGGVDRPVPAPGRPGSGGRSRGGRGQEHGRSAAPARRSGAVRRGTERDARRHRTRRGVGLYDRPVLESSDLSVAEIAVRAGFGTPLALRQQFTRVLRTTPTAYRRTFAG